MQELASSKGWRYHQLIILQWNSSEVIERFHLQLRMRLQLEIVPWKEASFEEFFQLDTVSICWRSFTFLHHRLMSEKDGQATFMAYSLNSEAIGSKSAYMWKIAWMFLSLLITHSGILKRASDRKRNVVNDGNVVYADAVDRLRL